MATNQLRQGPALARRNSVVAGARPGTVTRTAGWINGNLQKNVATGSAVARTFEIGDATAYTAEAHFDSGQVDQLVSPAELPARLADWLALLTSGDGRPAEPPGALGALRPPEDGWESVRAARAPERRPFLVPGEGGFDDRRYVLRTPGLRRRPQPGL